MNTGYNDEERREDYLTGEPHLVFVYGSLKLGFSNNALLRQHGAEFLGTRVTDAARFDMVSMGGFPAVLDGGEAKISGELYEASDACMRSLDRLESNGQFYQREVVCLRGGTNDSDGGDFAWMYLLMTDSGYYSPDGARYDRVEFSLPGNKDLVANWLQEDRTSQFRPHRKGY